MCERKCPALFPLLSSYFFFSFSSLETFLSVLHYHSTLCDIEQGGTHIGLKAYLRPPLAPPHHLPEVAEQALVRNSFVAYEVCQKAGFSLLPSG